MSITIKIPSILKKYTGEQETIEVEGRNIPECLGGLEAKLPEMRRWLYDKEGKRRPQIWFFVNGEKLFPDELNRPLKDGDEVSILLAISGG